MKEDNYNPKIKKNRNGDEINKVIALSNKLLVSSDRRSITIWKSNVDEENKINYEDYFEIVVDNDTCHLLEVNPSIFVATQYKPNLFQVYKNDGKYFPLLGELKNTFTHGNSSSGLAKINDNLVCSAAQSLFYIISIEPLQVVQKIIVENEFKFYLNFIHITKDNYLYHSSNDGILQYKIIYDEENNFQELKLLGNYIDYTYDEKAVSPLEDGRIFLISKRKDLLYYEIIA